MQNTIKKASNRRTIAQTSHSLLQMQTIIDDIIILGLPVSVNKKPPGKTFREVPFQFMVPSARVNSSPIRCRKATASGASEVPERSIHSAEAAWASFKVCRS